MGTVWASARAAGLAGPAWTSNANGPATATEATMATDLNARTDRNRRLPKLIRPLSGPHRRDATISAGGQRVTAPACPGEPAISPSYERISPEVNDSMFESFR